MLDILLVDDETNIHLLYTAELKSAIPNCSITSAYSGEEALEMMRRYTPDLILLDIRMTGMDGIEVLQRIKLINPFIPVFMVTAFDTYYDHIAVWNADEYIVKSFNLSELVSKINFYCVNKTTPTNIFINAFPFPIAYNFTCIRSKISSKEVLDYLLNLAEYIIRYLGCILIAQNMSSHPKQCVDLLSQYRNINMTMGKWCELLRKAFQLNNNPKSHFMPELISLLSSSEKDTPFQLFDKLITIRNEIHKRPYSERTSEVAFSSVKRIIRTLLDRCVFLKNYPLQIVESAHPNGGKHMFIYFIKLLMGSHPEFVVIPMHESSVLPYRQVFITKANETMYLNLHPFIAFDVCQTTFKDDVFLFDRIGTNTLYKSSQQGHILTKDYDLLADISHT
ncbi:MAG: response regulator [Syntrophobacteraceae bacterium]|jgi:CheY-like chemotaxis protein